LRSTYDLELRFRSRDLAEVTNEFHGSLEGLKNVNPDLEKVVRDVVKDYFNKGPGLDEMSKDQVVDEIRRKANDMRSFDSQRADRLYETTKDPNVLEMLNPALGCILILSCSDRALTKVNPDLTIAVRNELRDFFNKEGVSPISADALINRIRYQAMNDIRSSDVRGEHKWSAVDALGVRGRAEVERD
jgi:hypothetical protein